MQKRALLLNSTYEPLRIISWKRAFNLYFLGKIEILDEYDSYVRSVNQEFKIPAVVRLLDFARVKYNPNVKFSKTNVFIRDHYTCAYCGKTFAKHQLTIDHIVPVSYGGLKKWENVITACRPCNAKKGNRTPEKAGMKMHFQPKKPVAAYASYWYSHMQSMPDCWKIYLMHILPSQAT